VNTKVDNNRVVIIADAMTVIDIVFRSMDDIPKNGLLQRGHMFIVYKRLRSPYLLSVHTVLCFNAFSLNNDLKNQTGGILVDHGLELLEKAYEYGVRDTISYVIEILKSYNDDVLLIGPFKNEMRGYYTEICRKHTSNIKKLLE